MGKRNGFWFVHKALSAAPLLWAMALWSLLPPTAQAENIVTDNFTGFSCGGAFAPSTPENTEIRDCGNGVTIYFDGANSLNAPADWPTVSGTNLVQINTPTNSNNNTYGGTIWVLKSYTIPASSTFTISGFMSLVGSGTSGFTAFAQLYVYQGTVTNPLAGTTPLPLAASSQLSCPATCSTSQTATLSNLAPGITTITVVARFKDGGSNQGITGQLDNVIIDRVPSAPQAAPNTTPAPNGDLSPLWTSRNMVGNSELVALKTDASGNVYAIGTSSNQTTGGQDIFITKTSPAGLQLWQASYDGGGEDRVAGAVLDASGNLYVTGLSHNGTDNDYLTIKYDASGTQQWVMPYDNGGNDDQAAAIAIDSTGSNVYVTGKSCAGTTASCDYKTVKYNASGVQQWVATYDNGDRDEAVAIGLDGAGHVVVTGQSKAVNHDFATVQYDAGTGTQNWVKRYDAAGSNDYPVA